MRRRFQIAGALNAIIVAWVIVGVVRWPRVDPPSSPPSVVIALSANVASTDALDYAGTTRLTKAVAIARESHAVLVTTRVFRGSVSSDGGQRRIITAGGLADRWIVLPGAPGNTHDEALELRARYPTLVAIAVVTSPLHTRRACAVFEHVGFRVTCVASAQYQWWKVAYAFVYEQLAWVKYWQHGWIAARGPRRAKITSGVARRNDPNALEDFDKGVVPS
jgi:uncharacterized SAM-binding protein YcdF (DUF218 family)